MTDQEKFLNKHLGFLNLIELDFINIFVGGGYNPTVYINLGMNMKTTKFDDLYQYCHVIHDHFDEHKNLSIDEFDNKDDMYYMLIEKKF